MTIFCAQWAGLLGLWQLFTCRLATDELIVGAVASLLAALASHVTLTADLTHAFGRPRWVLQAWRLPVAMVADTWVVLRVLARHLFTRRPAGSIFVEVPFGPTGETPEEALRRALALAYTSMTPNSVVPGIDLRHHSLLLHQLTEAPVPDVTRALGAAP